MKCVADTCDRPYVARGLCTMHYQRWKVDPSIPTGGLMKRGVKPGIALLSFVEKVEFTDSCWLWTAVRHDNYGVFRGNQAHRWSYNYWVGPIPAGLVVDHLCKNPPCVNPDHLDAVTQRENLRRSGNWVAKYLEV